MSSGLNSWDHEVEVGGIFIIDEWWYLLNPWLVNLVFLQIKEVVINCMAWWNLGRLKVISYNSVKPILTCLLQTGSKSPSIRQCKETLEEGLLLIFLTLESFTLFNETVK